MEEETIRHDFKNHLAIIRGFSGILLGEARAGDPRDIEEICKASVTALNLLDRLYPARADAPQ